MEEKSFNFTLRFHKIKLNEEKNSNYHTHEIVVSGLRLMLKFSQKGEIWLNRKYVVGAQGKLKFNSGTRIYPRIEPDTDYLELIVRDFPRFPSINLAGYYYPHCRYNPNWNHLEEEEWMLHPVFLCETAWTNRIEIIHEKP